MTYKKLFGRILMSMFSGLMSCIIFNSLLRFTPMTKWFNFEYITENAKLSEATTICNKYITK